MSDEKPDNVERLMGVFKERLEAFFSAFGETREFGERVETLEADEQRARHERDWRAAREAASSLDTERWCVTQSADVFTEAANDLLSFLAKLSADASKAVSRVDRWKGNGNEI